MPTKLLTIIDAGSKREYPIVEVDDIFEPSEAALKFNGTSNVRSQRVVVVSEFILRRHAGRLEHYFRVNGIEPHLIPLRGGEASKSASVFLWLLDQFDRYRVDRRYEPIIAIGGGVITDVVGFAASCYRRGIPCIRVPTTLMGMADAAIGTKTGINLKDGKNRVGSFAPPLAVYIDYSFLSTLSKKDISNGMAEVLKTIIIAGHEQWHMLDDLQAVFGGYPVPQGLIANYARLSIGNTISELKGNLFEENLERKLDFGHTFSPAVEMANKELRHGEAVAIDIVLSAIIAHNRGLLDGDGIKTILNSMRALDLPLASPTVNADMLYESLQERMVHRGGVQRAPLPISNGGCKMIDNIEKKEIELAVGLSLDLSRLGSN